MEPVTTPPDSPDPDVVDPVAERVIGVVAKVIDKPREAVALDSKFEELGADSLDGINLLFALEEEFDIEIPDDVARNIEGVREIVEELRPLVEGEAAGPPG